MVVLMVVLMVDMKDVMKAEMKDASMVVLMAVEKG
jgi:hypothetical protein